MDLQINDNQFSIANRGDDLSLIFSDDGIVQKSLDNKEKKLDVILEFKLNNGFFDYEYDTEMRQLINGLTFKLFTAKILRNYQEEIKESLGGESFHGAFKKRTDHPLIMRLISKVIQITAEKQGLGQ